MALPDDGDFERKMEKAIQEAFESIDIDYGTFKGKKDFKNFVSFCARMGLLENDIIRSVEYFLRRSAREDELNRVMDHVNRQMQSRQDDLTNVRRSVITTFVTLVAAALSGGVAAWIATHK